MSKVTVGRESSAEDIYSYRFALLTYGKVPRKASKPTPAC
jgi:hypothetical protein